MNTLAFIVKRWSTIMLLAGLGTAPFAQAQALCTPKWGDFEVMQKNIVSNDMGNLRIGADDHGNIHAAYFILKDRRTRQLLVVQRRTPNGVWQKPQLLREYNVKEPQVPLSDLRLSISSNGHALLAWHSGLSSPEFPEVAVYDPNTGWGTPTPLTQLGSTTQMRGLTTSMNANGVGIVALSNSGQIAAHHHSPQTGWGQPHLIPLTAPSNEAEAVFYSMLSLAQNASGRAVLAWREPGTGPKPTAAIFDPLTGWTAPTILTARGSFGGSDMAIPVPPQATIDAAGNAFVVWEHIDSSRPTAKSEIWAARSGPVGSWLPAEILSTKSGSDAFSPTVAAQDGRAVAFWIRQKESRIPPFSKFSIYDSATGWSPEGDATPSQMPDQISGQVAHLSSANVVTLARYFSVTGRVETSVRSLGEGLGEPVIKRHNNLYRPWSFATNGLTYQVIAGLQFDGASAKHLLVARVAAMQCGKQAQPKH